MSEDISIKYTECYVAFLDVLGFKNMVYAKNGEEIISRYLSTIKSRLRNIEHLFDDIDHIVISDSIVLSIKADEKQSKSCRQLRHLCMAVQSIQAGLAEIDIWLRGAISKGPAYFNAQEGQVIGPAYTDAYLLEVNSAIYPRVILDVRIVNQLGFRTADELIGKVGSKGPRKNCHLGFTEDVLFRWDDDEMNIRVDKDAPLFVNYMTYFLNSEDNLKLITGYIVDSMYRDNSIYPKFRWVADYLLSYDNCLRKRMPSIDVDKIIAELN